MDIITTTPDCASHHSPTYPAEFVTAPAITVEAAFRTKITEIKAAILTQSIVIDSLSAQALEQGGWKAPRMVRSGMSGGLEFYLISNGQKFAISCACTFRQPRQGEYSLEFDGGFHLIGPTGEKAGDVEFLPEPSYYRQQTTSGISMANVAQRCFSKLAIGVFGSCAFNVRTETTCAFCAIHLAAPTDAIKKADKDIIETVEAALDSELGSEIESIMLGGGTPGSPGRGADRFASLATSLHRKVPWRITAMMAPPADDSDLMRLRDSGISEMSINLEFGSADAFARYTPGKAHLIGRKRYYECLEKAVELFGEGNVQSILVTGIEPAEATLQAVRWLVERKIVPVLSPFRPIPGAPLANMLAPQEEDVLELYFAAREVAESHNFYLGPRCVPCQCNTMSLPWDAPNQLL